MDSHRGGHGGRPYSAGLQTGGVLIVLPHAIGAPHPEAGGGLVPKALWEKFILTALMASAAFWVVMGLCAGYFFNRQKG